MLGLEFGLELGFCCMTCSRIPAE